MNATTASCGHAVIAVGAPHSPARIRVESMPCDACNDDQAPIGSRWHSDAGTDWTVLEHDGAYVTVERDGRPGDTYRWHVTSLTRTTMRRIA